MTAMNNNEMLEHQRAFCRERGHDCVPADPASKVGFAIQTQGLAPINGLRHPAQGDTNGWYIWCGEKLSSEPDFFSPLHTHHLAERCPEAIRFLGLPPGYRFLVAGEYIDVWFDPTLLEV